MRASVSRVEAFFERYQFTTRHLLCASDCESIAVGELLALAGMAPERLLDLRLTYTRGDGSPALREQIASLYRSVDASRILCLGSPMEGIYLTVRALVDPGDHVVVLAPAFSPLLEVPRMLGAKVSLWEVRSDGREWKAELAELEATVQPDTRLIVVNFPHNPTGFSPSGEFVQGLARIADRSGSWILSDEIFRGLEPHGPACASLADVYPRAVALSGLSKVFGLPGLRVGWLAVPDIDARQELFDWRAYTSQCSPGPSELLACAALSAREELLRRNRAIVQANLDLAEPFFARWSDRFHYLPPAAGTTALVEWRDGAATQLCHRLAAERSVMLLPGACFEMEDRYLRFGFGRRDFAEGLDVLDRDLASAFTPLNAPCRSEHP
jgi:aspartate/methionine/tyrosine aminotransferase